MCCRFVNWAHFGTEYPAMCVLGFGSRRKKEEREREMIEVSDEVHLDAWVICFVAVAYVQ